MASNSTSGDFIQTAVNGYDLAQQTEQVSPCVHGYKSNGLMPDNVGVRQFAPGIYVPQYGLSGFAKRGQGGINAHNLFKASGPLTDVEFIALSAIGWNTTPVAGDLCFAFDGTLMEYTRTNEVTAFQKWQATFKARGVCIPAFPALLVNASQKDTLTSAVYDDGAESVGSVYGGVSILEVLTPTGVVATNSVGLSGLPSAADTFTLVIGGVTYIYTWRATTISAAGDILIGATVAACLSNLFQALVGDLTGSGIGYYAGTTPLPSTVIVSAPGAAAITLTAVSTGVGPNAWTAVKSGTNLTVGGATFTGGVAGETATIVVQSATASGGSYSTVATHTLNMTARGAEIIAVPVGTTINRYLKAVITLSGATQTWAVRIAFGRWFAGQA